MEVQNHVPAVTRPVSTKSGFYHYLSSWITSTLGKILLGGLMAVIWLLISFRIHYILSKAFLNLFFILSTTKVDCTATKVEIGQIVRVECPTSYINPIQPPIEFIGNMKPVSAGSLNMTVEMYQWQPQSSFSSIYRKPKSFIDHLVKNNDLPYLYRPFAKNPNIFPSVPKQNYTFSTRIKVGNFEIPSIWFSRLDLEEELVPLTNSKAIYKPTSTKPPLTVNSVNTQVWKNSLYTGDPLNPTVGDLRITFFSSKPQKLLVIGKVKSYNFDGSVNLEAISNESNEEIFYLIPLTGIRKWDIFLGAHQGDISSFFTFLLQIMLAMIPFIAIRYTLNKHLSNHPARSIFTLIAILITISINLTTISIILVGISYSLCILLLFCVTVILIVAVNIWENYSSSRSININSHTATRDSTSMHKRNRESRYQGVKRGSPGTMKMLVHDEKDIYP